jgi:eukaryotic-like serine/threonine-protein kinase
LPPRVDPHNRAQSVPLYETDSSDSLERRVPTTAPEGEAGSRSDDQYPTRYEARELLALGGMGEVRRVWDRVLDRSVAMKLLSGALLRSARARARFQAEIGLTAGLEHPGIVSVYDAGQLAGGRPWYTMRLLEGRTLDRVIGAQHAAPGLDSSKLRHLIRALYHVCDAIVYAHTREVIHRDLKPQNIMVNRMGEVLILDWGLAKRAGVERAFELDVSSAELSVGDGRGLLTRAGDILGTPAYMSPEQARGEIHLIGPKSDVYALGAILYEMLAGTPPFVGDATGILRMACASAPAPLAPQLPNLVHENAESLLDLCARCLAFDPEQRPEVHTVTEELRRWLERERRADEARRAIAKVEEHEPEISELKSAAAALRNRARELLAGLPSYAPPEEKALAWELETRAEEIERRAIASSVRWLQGVRAALSIEPSSWEAHTRLARHYARELRDAEARRDSGGMAVCEALLLEHDRGEHRALLTGHGRLSLRTTPSGAQVEAHRYVERLRRLELSSADTLGRTPLEEVSLPAGSYVLVLRADGRAAVRYPVHIVRGEHWDCLARGSSAPTPVPLPFEAELDPEHEAYVPPGWFASGGDARAVESLAARRIWVDGFVVQRVPVDNRSYLAFLNDCVARGDSRSALRHAPRLPRGSGGVTASRADEEPLAYARNESGEFHLAPSSAATPWELDGPVALIDWHAARAYAQWYAARTDKPFRLLNELEWEKAARGVDGRLVAWGDHIEPTHACMLGSHAGVPRPMRPSAFPLDESPYGVRGMTGSVRNWCENVWSWDGPRLTDNHLLRDLPSPEDEALRAVRGGAWSAMPDFCRAAARFALSPTERLLAVGFRLAYSWPSLEMGLAEEPWQSGMSGK